jgi:hypothetical protein
MERTRATVEKPTPRPARVDLTDEVMLEVERWKPWSFLVVSSSFEVRRRFSASNLRVSFAKSKDISSS